MRHALVWVGLVLLIVGAKLWLIDTAGRSMPAWEQIDGEGESVIRPWAEGRLDTAAIWQPHHEHHLVLTKLLALGLISVNHQWDNYVEMLANAVLHALWVPFFLHWLHRRVQGAYFALLAVVVTAFWVLPVGWENSLSGFQSQIYFLIWLTFVQLRGVLGARTFGWRWTVGQLGGFLALGSTAAGIWSSAAVAVAVVALMIRQHRCTRFDVVTTGLSLLWVAIGVIIRAPAPAHLGQHAENLGEAFSAFNQIVAWPVNAWLPVSMVFGAPLVLAVIQLLRRSATDGFDRTFLGFALWFGLMAGSIAWTSGHDTPLASRFRDFFVIGLVLQAVALTLHTPRRWRTGLMAIWGATIALFLVERVRHDWRENLLPQIDQIHQQEESVRQFLATQDRAILSKASADDLRYPVGDRLAELWSPPAIQRVMPAAVRAPVAIPIVPANARTGLPPAPYPVIAASPSGAQTTSWRWQSETQSADTLPILRFRFSGGLGDPEAVLSMRIVGEDGSIDVVPDGPARNRWKTINVFRPPGPWHIELTDSDGAEHLALTAPVELGWLSWATEKLIKYHLWISCAGIALLLGGSLASNQPKESDPRLGRP